MILKNTPKEIALAAKQIGRALKGLDQVSFHFSVSIHGAESEFPFISTEVTLWFGSHFRYEVKGGDDITKLARECRGQAESNLLKMRDIVKAAE